MTRFCRLGQALAGALAIAVSATVAGCGGSKPQPSEPTPAPTQEQPQQEAQAQRQFDPASFWNASIPRDVRFADDKLRRGSESVAVNPGVGEELQAYARRADGSSNTWVNFEKYTSRVVVVPADQELQPVKLCRVTEDCVPDYAGALDQVLRGVDADGRYLGGGLPIPDDVPLPAPDDTDSAVVFYQPDYVAPDGKRGRLYEAWQFRRNDAFDKSKPASPENTRYSAAWGGRIVGVNGQGVGHYRDCFWSGCGNDADTKADPSAWGKPDSQAESKDWGVTATSLPLTASQMGLADCRRGRLDHGIGVEVPYARAGTTWWPAQRNDGAANDKVVSEGMRLTFPRSTRPPKALTPVGRAVWDAAYKYGVVVDDQSASSLNFRAEPGCENTELFRSSKSATQDLLRAFPWEDLRVIAQGSDETPNPRKG